jgi:hypothetical protein
MPQQAPPSRLIYQVYVGDPVPLYDKCVATVERYCKRHGIKHVVQREPILKIRPNPETNGRSVNAVERLGYLPIFEKENALEFLGDQYDQVAIIDSDVWIQPKAPNIFDELDDETDFMGVVERSAPITAAYARKLLSYAHGQYSDPKFPFMNMGVMLMNKGLRAHCPESPREFLARPDFQPFVDGRGSYKWSTDQTLLNHWLSSCGARVKPLDWRWNTLYGAVIQGSLEQAHFIHFFLKDHLTSQDPSVLLKSAGRPRV